MTKLIFRSLLALLFSLLFIFSRWNQMVVNTSPDIMEYLLRINNLLSGSDTDVESMGLLQYLSNEPIWRYILILFGEYFDGPINGLLLVSFCSIFIYAFFLFGRINLFLASFFLFNPMVVDLVMAQVRSALAMALCLIALMVKNRSFGLVVVAIASLIHTVTFVFFIVYIFAKFLELNRNSFTYKQLGIAALFFGLVLSLILGAGREVILGAIGDRRFEPRYTKISFFYLSYWMLLALVLAQPLIQRYKDSFREYWTVYYSIVMLALPFLMALFGTNSVRFAALSFPIFLYSMSMYTIQIRALLISTLFAYQIIQYDYWLRNF